MPLSSSVSSLRTHERRRWIALVTVCLGQLMNALDMTIVNVALPSIQRELHFSQASLTWTVNAYLISFGSFLLLAGRLGDLIGRKRVFLAGVTLFTVASALCALAGSQAVLVAARFLQGLGGALSSSVIIAIIVTEFSDPAARARAMSTYIFVAVAGGSIGLLVGGLVTQALNWHWIFFINLPVGLAAIALGAAFIRENQGLGLSQGVDVLGSMMVTVAVMLGVYAIVGSTDYGLGSARTLTLGGVAVLLLAAFLGLEARLDNPILPLRILRLRALVGSSLVRGLVFAGMSSVFFMGAVYLERVLHYNPIQTGQAFLPMTVTVALLSFAVTARLVSRFGAWRTLVGGLLAMATGLLLLTRLGEQATYFPWMPVVFVLLGVGGGTSFAPLLTIGMADVPSADAGLGSAIINVSMQIAGALGLAVFGTVASNRAGALLAQGHTLEGSLAGGYQLVYVLAAACVMAGLGVALTVLRPRRPRQASAVEARAA
jgi:EmrB/QacA subfamily drug resistance transporter